MKNSLTGSFARKERVAAFTLIEMLAVISIMVIIASFLAPTVGTILRGKEITRAASDISAMMDVARTEAMSKNTYVWLGFKSTTLNGGPTSPLEPGIISKPTSYQLQVAAVRSSDGTPNLTVTGSTAGISLPNYTAFTRVLRFDNIELDNGASLTSKVKDLLPGKNSPPIPAVSDVKIPAVVSKVAGASPNVPQNSDKQGGFRIPQKAGAVAATDTTTIQFFRIILFTPQGEAMIFDDKHFKAGTMPGYTQQILVGLRRTVSGNQIPNTTDSAAIVLFGGTGQNRIYRLQ